SEAEQLPLHAGKGAALTLLGSNPLRKKMLPGLIHLQAHKATPREQTPAGTERFLYLLRGRLEVTVGEEKIPLAPGDSLYFQAHLPHWLKNAGSSPAAVLTVTTPPSV
ncbi:MAG: cupin domain-containing protein, partial [Candidatus Omnitrophica bacterium]|nr:cupin domain-containing protein [Candidatus Omnitrophota bacterium]